VIQFLDKWHVTVELSNGRKTDLWLSDNFASNVLRAVAGIQFDANPLVNIEKVTVELVKSEQPHITMSTT
jgi:hypothetical protein